MARRFVRIETNLVYSRIQELGGTIVPKNSARLRFDVDGETVFAKTVTIPARPYLRPAFDSKRDAAVREIARVFRKAVERSARS